MLLVLMTIMKILHMMAQRPATCGQAFCQYVHCTSYTKATVKNNTSTSQLVVNCELSSNYTNRPYSLWYKI